MCDCGAIEHGWPHSNWCQVASENMERRRCEGAKGPCDISGPTVQLESSRTMYHWDGKGEDPNRDVWLCPDCAKEHHDYWDEMWSYANSGRL